MDGFDWKESESICFENNNFCKFLLEIIFLPWKQKRHRQIGRKDMKEERRRKAKDRWFGMSFVCVWRERERERKKMSRVNGRKEVGLSNREHSDWEGELRRYVRPMKSNERLQKWRSGCRRKRLIECEVESRHVSGCVQVKSIVEWFEGALWSAPYYQQGTNDWTRWSAVDAVDSARKRSNSVNAFRVHVKTNLTVQSGRNASWLTWWRVRGRKQAWF
jgi:hypothetical protein